METWGLECGAGDAQVGEQLCDGSRCPWSCARSAWRVSCPGSMCSASAQAARRSSASRADWRGATVQADGVAGPDIEHDVEVEPVPFVGAGEFGDVPGPHLVRSVSDEFGFDVGGVAGLAAPFADLVLGAQDPVHGRHRGQVVAFVEQGRPDLGGGLVAEPLGVQHGEDLVDLGVGERPMGSGSRSWRPGGSWRAVLAVVGGAGAADRSARPHPGDAPLDELVDSGVDDGVYVSSVSTLLESSSKSACTFPWTSMIASALARLGSSTVRSRHAACRSRHAVGVCRPPAEARPSLTTRVPSRC